MPLIWTLTHSVGLFVSPVMSRSVGCPMNMGATALESLSSLQRRLQSAEEQSEELVRGLNILGVSADHLLLNSSASSSLKHPVSPVNIHQGLGADGEGLLWRLCETLVSRVCRLESLLHALKLATFRLETDKELNPSHSGQCSFLKMSFVVCVLL